MASLLGLFNRSARDALVDFASRIAPNREPTASLTRVTRTWRLLCASMHSITDDTLEPNISLGAGKKDKRFVDRRRVVVTAGNGGSGAVSFAKDGGAKRRRGADGGNGGNGGDVWVKAVKHVKALGDLPFRIAGGNGGKGAAQGTQGRRGEEIELKVPVGTVVWKELEDKSKEIPNADVGWGDDIDFSRWGTSVPVSQDDEDDDGDKEEVRVRVPNFGERPRGIHKGNWEVLADLSENGARVRLARGGRGGKGNRSKPTGKLAGTRDLGTDGEKITVVLELKSVADVGLVGFPNSGKSTLLRAISGAQPKVAGFAFTTMHPQLGAVMTDGGLSSITVADIPGLIEGAHMNRGLGHNFLRHIERCAAFIFVVDLSAGLGHTPGMRPWEALEVLKAELDAYLPGLSDRPAIVVGTKTDLLNTSRAAAALRRKTDLPVVTLSAKEAKGLEDLLEATEGLLQDIQKTSGDEGLTREAQ